MPPYTPSRTHLWLGPIIGLLGALFILAPPAFARSAAPTESVASGATAPYGEVARFGGFDTTAYANGNYSGKLTPGEFLDPVGFAVDPSDASGGSGGAVYVLDRTSDIASAVKGTTTTWRLQKLSDTGAVLGTDQFSLPVGDPNSTTTSYYNEILGLTVDHATGSVYALVDAANNNVDGSQDQGEAVAEILGWSTTPNGSHQLVAAAGLPADTLSAGITGFPTPGRLSTQAQLTDSSTGAATAQLPQGLAVDATGGANYLAVQVGVDPTPSADGASGIVQVCAQSKCGASTSGAVTDLWSSEATSKLDDGEGGENAEQAAGIATAPDGSLIAEFVDGGILEAASEDVVDVPANLSSAPSELEGGQTAMQFPGTTTPDLDNGTISTAGQEAVVGNVDPPSYLPAPEVVGLSNGLFAAEFEPDQAGASDPETLSGGPGLWTNLNPGVRLLAPEGGSGGPISNITPPLASLVDTLGNPTPNPTPDPQPSTTAASACNLSDSVTAALGAADSDNVASNPSLAAGANGAIWVLTRGSDSSPNVAGDQNHFSDPTGAREVIELAPGAGTPCPGPSGTFSVSAGGAPQPASTTTPLTVTLDSTVTFDESTFNYLGGATDEYVWNYGDGSAPVTVTADEGVGPFHDENTYPLPTTSHTYTKLGSFPVSLTVYGDFGVSTLTGTVVVQNSAPPVASFTFSPTAPTTGNAVSFDASASLPGAGAASIADYNWNWGDGTSDDSGTSPTDSHTYTTPGTYTVTLTIHDSKGEPAELPEAVTVTAASTTTTTTTTTPPPTTSTPTTTPTTPVTTSPPPAPKVTTKFSSKISKGTESIVVSCPAGQTSCSGSVTLKTAKAVAASIARKHKKTRKAILKLGSARFTVPAAKSTTIHIRFTGKALALLRKSHSVAALVTLEASNPQGQSDSRSFRVTLHYPTTQKKKKK